MLASAAAWLESQRLAHLATNVAYRPKSGGQDITCRATIITGQWESVDAAGQVVRMQTRDYIIAVADLAAAPQRGDKVIETDAAGVQRTYEVAIPGGANNPWQWGDVSRRSRRIHTMLVGES